MELDNNLKKRFCKDFRLPINVYQEPYFSYFKELYEPVFQIDEKLTWLNKAIEEGILFKITKKLMFKNQIIKIKSFIKIHKQKII